MNIEPHAKRFIPCPNCGEGEHAVEHLFHGVGDPDDSVAPPPRDFGPWHCGHCDHQFFGETKPDGTVEITKVEPIKEPRIWCLVRFKDVYLVVGSYRDYGNGMDYMIHSHQCPENLLRNVCGVWDAELGWDPHGILRLVATVPAADFDPDQGGDLAALFRAFKTDGSDAPTEWPEENHGVLPFIADMQRDHRKTKAPKG